MPDWVVCAECHTRYEATQFSFCTRCGSTARAGSGAPVPVSPLRRRDPARMRLQLGGVLLLAVGLVFVGSAVLLFMNPAWSQGTSFDQLGQSPADPTAPAGDIQVHVTDSGVDLRGANVSVTAGNRTVATGTTGADGRYNATLTGSFAVNVTVQAGNGTWVRRALAPHGFVVPVDVDIGRDARSTDRVAGPEELFLVTGIAWLVMSLLMVLGGLAAVLVRWRGLALGGPLPTVAFVLWLAVLLFQAGIAILLPIVLVVMPYALVVSGRSAFRRP